MEDESEILVENRRERHLTDSDDCDILHDSDVRALRVRATGFVHLPETLQMACCLSEFVCSSFDIHTIVLYEHGT